MAEHGSWRYVQGNYLIRSGAILLGSNPSLVIVIFLNPFPFFGVVVVQSPPSLFCQVGHQTKLPGTDRRTKSKEFS